VSAASYPDTPTHPYRPPGDRPVNILSPAKVRPYAPRYKAPYAPADHRARSRAYAAELQAGLDWSGEMSLVRVAYQPVLPKIEIVEVPVLPRPENSQWLLSLLTAVGGLLVALFLGASPMVLLVGLALASTGGIILALINAAKRSSRLAAAFYISAGSLLFYEIIEMFAKALR